jgi:WD40 repeat protein
MPPSESYLNTINCLNFSKANENVFLVGSRDGVAKIYDLRSDPCSKGPCLSFRAHQTKLNQIVYNSTDSLLLSSGRDSCIRLWDLRYLDNQASSLKEFNNKVQSKSFITEYKSHKC